MEQHWQTAYEWYCQTFQKITNMCASGAPISEKLIQALLLSTKYKWLLDSYVLDFYVDEHWQKLPLSWQQHFEHLPMELLGQLLTTEYSPQLEHLWPLELTVLRRLLHKLCIPRKQCPEKPLNSKCDLLQHNKLKHIFRKCVKPKKWHEITHMAAICASNCKKSEVELVIDFGGGLGHLARILAYGYGIKVCCIEMQAKLNEQASSIDRNFEALADKFLSKNERSHFKRPTHLTERLSSDTKPQEFIDRIKYALELEDHNISFGIVGLHPCGDLGPILMRMFVNCKQAKFINFVGCCYQKLSTPNDGTLSISHGYPMSEFLRKRTHLNLIPYLSYEAREVSCHATEIYYDRLVAGEYENLKIHSFRAAAERVIVQYFPDMKHMGLRNVKHVPGMCFQDYFQKAIQGTRLEPLFQNTSIMSDNIENDLLKWHSIVVFYTLRLMLAPLVESIILYDRMLFLQEAGCQVQIDAIFNARISPRNHIITASKN